MLIYNLKEALKNKIYYFVGWIRASFLGVRLSRYACVSPYANICGAAYIGNAKIAANVTLGKGSYINSGIIESGIIGNYCSIAYGCLIGPTEHKIDYWTTSPYEAIDNGDFTNPTTKDVPPPNINNRVWIGANAIILRGVNIGEGAIIAAGAVVTKNIPPNELWGGIPAKKIKKL